MTTSDDKVINAINFILILVAMFAVSPFVIMYVWNTLATHMFGAFTIGYGGAWALIILRQLLPKNKTVEQTPEESLQSTLLGYLNYGVITIATLIIGLSFGAL